MPRLIVLAFSLWLAAVVGCEDGSIGGSTAALNKFETLPELLQDTAVQTAISRLPASGFLGPGQYHQGSTPADISGVWSTACCGGQGGLWPPGNGFGGTFTFRAAGPGRVDMLSAEGKLDYTDGLDSFVVGAQNNITLFLQLSIVCREDGERVRAVAIDRFTREGDTLTNYVRSYVILARDHGEPWTCFVEPVGSGSVSTPAQFGKRS